jgi:hypothetical protein
MIDVSNRLKANLLIAFIKEQIENSSVDYSMYHSMAIERFGIMPSLKGRLSETEKVQSRCRCMTL